MPVNWQEPRTDAEWRKAAALATVYLQIDSARRYGFIEGGPTVNCERCVELIEKAKARGIVTTNRQIDRALKAVVATQAAPA